MADNEHSLATYVSDMLALERHISEPFDTQLKSDDFKGSSDGLEAVTRLSALAHTHADALVSCLDALGGHEASPVKSAFAGLAGSVASAIDKMRKTEVSKGLRDDYTALALCTAGYEMLHATALGMRDQNVAALAQRHLRDYAQAAMEISEILPIVVIAELSDLGLDVDHSAIEATQRAAKDAWTGGDSSQYASQSNGGSYATAAAGSGTASGGSYGSSGTADYGTERRTSDPTATSTLGQTSTVTGTSQTPGATPDNSTSYN